MRTLLVVDLIKTLDCFILGPFHMQSSFTARTVWLTLAVTAYTDKTVQIDTELMRVYWFSFKVRVSEKDY